MSGCFSALFQFYFRMGDGLSNHACPFTYLPNWYHVLLFSASFSFQVPWSVYRSSTARYKSNKNQIHKYKAQQKSWKWKTAEWKERNSVVNNWERTGLLEWKLELLYPIFLNFLLRLYEHCEEPNSTDSLKREQHSTMLGRCNAPAGRCQHDAHRPHNAT